jgi:hypothetical protein
MKVLAGLLLVMALAGGAVSAYAGAGDADDCHSISDSVYGSWGCR